MRRQVRPQTSSTTDAGPDRLPASACALLALLMGVCSAGRGDWSTCRGNPGRTGSLDDRAGPKSPQVLWAYKSQEHFVASPVPVGEALYVGGLGPFNTGVLHCLSTQPRAPERARWSKAAPFVKRPTVCAPAVAGGLVVFGDGMHQTDNAVLYCLHADSGLGLWQLPLPGKLVHLEGSPTIDGGRVYIGGGDAGVLCVDLKRVTLDGKPHEIAAVTTLLQKRWAELVAKYEQDRKKDPDFAMPPSEEALPKPAPVLLWQRGKSKWHVDAPVAVSGDRVLAASAYLDHEKVGKRCLLCLRASDGGVLWEAPLRINPWAGPTVAGQLVLVGCSNIRFDTERVKEARGEVAAIDLAAGRPRWRKAVPGGVLSPIAVKGDLAIFTATDGKVRAWKAETGEVKWAYQGASPFFAGCAIAGGTVYAADLKGVVHAVGLADGEVQWTFDATADPAVRAPGMVFGSPVVHGGRIYLATCNLQGGAAGQPSAVVCIADKSDGTESRPGPYITVDRRKHALIVPCRIAPRKLPTLKEVYPIEVIATHPSPRGQKAHETVITCAVRPSSLHRALERLGLKPGKPASGEGVATGAEVSVLLEFPGITGRPRVVPIEKTLVDRRTGRAMPALKWYFTGSAMRQPDPDKDQKVYGADLTGTFITLFPVTDDTVLQSNLTMVEERLLKLETNKDLLPDEGTPAKLIIRALPGARGAGEPSAMRDRNE